LEYKVPKVGKKRQGENFFATLNRLPVGEKNWMLN
jgi:hypothetical protein